MKRIAFAGIFFIIASFGFASDLFYNNHLYLGLRAGGSANLYLGDYEESFTLNGAASAYFKFAKFFGLQLEVVYVHDKTSDDDFFSFHAPEYTYAADSLAIPLLARFSFNPGRAVLGPFVGFYLNIPLGDLKVSVINGGAEESLKYKTGAFGYMVGGDFGFELGPGAIFLDLRFITNSSSLRYKDKTGDVNYAWIPIRFPITIGYEIGLFKRK
jgi:hypothetical protein